MISTQNKDRLCKCQAVCFEQLKANFSCAVEVYDDNDGDVDGNDACIESLSCMSHSIMWYYNHYINDYTSSFYYISSWLLTSAKKTSRDHHDGNDYDVSDYKGKEDKWIRF